MGEATTPVDGKEQAANAECAGDNDGLLDEWMSRDELARELKLSVDTLSRWETRRIGPPCVRVGRRVLYRRGAVRDWLRAQEDRASGRNARVR